MNRPQLRKAALVAFTTITLALTGCSDVASSLPAPLKSVLSPTSVEEASKKAETATPAAVTTPTIKTAGVLTVGIRTSKVSAPFAVVDTASNEISGIDADLASEIADELGLKVSFVSVTDLTNAKEVGCDIVMDVKAGDSADYSVVGSYYENAVGVFSKGSAKTLTSGDLSGKSVGVQRSSSSQNTLSKTGITMNQKEYSNLNEAFKGLEAGEVDYVMCEAYPGGYLAASYGDISCDGTLDIPSSTGIGVLTSNTALQQVVSDAAGKVISNGEYAITRKRWIGSLPTLTSSSQVQGVTITSSSTGSSETASDTTSGNGSSAGANAATI